MSDEPTQPDQPDQPMEPDQPDQPDQPEQSQDERGYPAGSGNADEANENAKTNVGGEYTDDESKIAEKSSLAHNERVGSEK